MDDLYDVIVFGGGYAAAEESVFLAKFARHMTILIRKDNSSCAVSVADQPKNHEKITVLTNTVMEEVFGENGLSYARYKNTATGPGLVISNDTRQQTAAITDTVDMKILVTLSCTMCPDLVAAAQRIAAESPHVTAHVYDIHHYEKSKERYQTMSGPCFVIIDDRISFESCAFSQGQAIPLLTYGTYNPRNDR